MHDSFCHVFLCGGRTYAYDVNTNGIVEIDSPTAAVLSNGGAVGDDSVSPAELSDACDRIAAARREQGLFLPQRPSAVAPCPACHATDGYDGRAQQLTLSVSEQCNLRCAYCLHGNDLDWMRPHRDARMSRDTALSAVREFLRRSREVEEPVISFYGGEPLLEFDLIREVVALVRREGSSPRYRFTIDTNGTLLTDDVADFIATEGINLQISLDGPPEIHDRHRRFHGGGPTHAAIMTGLRRLLRRAPQAIELMRFQVTLVPPGNIEAVAEYFAGFRLFHEFGCDEEPFVGVNSVNLDGADLGAMGISEADLVAFDADMAAARARYLEACVAGEHNALSPVLHALFDSQLITFYHRSRNPLPDVIAPGGCCRPGQRRLHVRADGAYQPCERVGDGLIIGGAEGGLDLEAVETLWRRYTDALGDRCLDCWACRLCSLCFTVLAEGWQGDGEQTILPESECEAVRRGLERTLAMHAEMLRRNPRSQDFLKGSVIS